MEAWAKRVWKLEGRIAIYPLNQNLFFMGFELSEEARWVMEKGSRICRGGEMQLEWWTLYSGCNKSRDQENEVWIRVVGLPLHLWTGEILKKIGDNCGGFVALDEGTTSKTELLWARILVKMNINVKPISVNLLAGARSYELQIWWEFRPTVAEVFPRSSRTSGGPADPGEKDDRVARANGRVKTGWAVKRHDYRDGQSKVGSRTTLGSEAAESRLSISQPRGMKSKVGPKICFEIQNVVGIRGRKGKPNDFVDGLEQGKIWASLGGGLGPCFWLDPRGLRRPKLRNYRGAKRQTHREVLSNYSEGRLQGEDRGKNWSGEP